MEKVKIAVLVSGGGTNLQALIDAQQQGTLTHGKIVLVISSSPEAYALQRAYKNDIPCEVVSKKEYTTQQAFEERILRSLEENHIDLIVLAGFMNILSEQFTSRYPKRILNIHPSLIPSFCGKGFYGLRVHEAALAAGVKLTGATVHFVNEIPDGGEIIMQKAVVVRAGDTPEKLQKRVMKQAEWQILPRAVQTVCKSMVRDSNQAEHARRTRRL